MKLFTYHVYLTLGKRKRWALEDECAIGDGNEGVRDIKIRLSDIVICGLESHYVHGL